MNDLKIKRFEKELENLLNGIDMKVKKNRLFNNSRLSDKQKSILSEFNKRMLLDNIKLNTRLNKIRFLKRMAIELNKEFDDITRNDLEDYISQWKFAKGSQALFRTYLKCFFKWLKGYEDDYPPEVKWIKVKLDNKTKMSSDMITQDELKELVNACDNYRDKAIIMCLYEGALRLSECLDMKIKDVFFDKFGCVLNVSGKTGQRRVRVKDAEPYLTNWLNCHPFKHDINKSLFINLTQNNYAGKVGIIGWGQVLKRIVKRTNIKKKIHPHLFRHTRLTELAQFLTEQQLKIFAGWVNTSRMAGVYVHLSGADIDKKMLEVFGLKQQEQKREQKEVGYLICPRCNSKNPFDSVVCSKCTYVLDIKRAKKDDNTKEFNDLKNKVDIMVKALGETLLEGREDPKIKRVIEQLKAK
jgi:integrase/recombinase XerD